MTPDRDIMYERYPKEKKRSPLPHFLIAGVIGTVFYLADRLFGIYHNSHLPDSSTFQPLPTLSVTLSPTIQSTTAPTPPPPTVPPSVTPTVETAQSLGDPNCLDFLREHGTDWIPKPPVGSTCIDIKISEKEKTITYGLLSKEGRPYSLTYILPSTTSFHETDDLQTP